LRDERLTKPASVAFDARGGGVHFAHRDEAESDVIGPMVVRLHVELVDADDILLFAGVRKRRNGRTVGFEGSYGFPAAMVTVGWLKASHRHLDPERSRPGVPWHDHSASTVAPLRPGEKVAVDIELLPSATRFRAGDELELVVQGRWFFPRNPLTGQFPAVYESSRRGRCIVHCGGPFDSVLQVPRPADP
jgi:predicted acyl esterase